jgi:response regulator RpfG family c-di-GMP phosphodiesterase
MNATLLCVDDEPNILSALRRLFRPEGYRVHVAPGGAEGLALLEREAVDVVISDMRMPEMSGAELLKRIAERWPGTERILLTGYADMDSTVAAINEGRIARYIAKPWNDDEVRAVVRDALERKSLRDEKRRLEALTAAQNAELKALNATLEQKVEARTAALRRSLLNGVRVFAGVIELRSDALAAHGKRVAERARAVALQLGLGPSEAQHVAIAGLLHDIGKLALPDAALLAPANALKPEHREDFLKHPARGADLLAVLESTRAAGEIARAHHERFDGSGFPKSLRGSEIPVGARILAVADDFDEAVCGLLTGTQLTSANALAYLREGRGRRYDPAVVDAFVSLCGNPGEERAPAVLSLRPSQLEPGMIVVRDVVGADGKLLLVSDYALDQPLIDGLLDYERSAGSPLRVTVRVPARGA